ncbi:MAG: hypothetical protein U0Q12_24795 [Vicinamibacterales bacterium]
MKTVLVALGITLVGPTLARAADIPPAAAQIAATLLAAPEERRAEATVLGYDPAGKVVPLKKGTNDLVCIADNPNVEGFSAACYHKDLDPFMARGRDMTASGITDDKVRDQTRWKEISDGKLAMPREPRMLYVLTGKSYDAASNTVTDAYTRWVIYLPFATPETTGFSTKPAPGQPWLMDPGTAGAHIMISPPRPK